MVGTPRLLAVILRACTDRNPLRGWTMISRRAWLGMAVASGAALGMNPRILEALQELQIQPLLQRAIPKTGELLPVIGLGSANTFSEMARTEARTEQYDMIGAVLRRLSVEVGPYSTRPTATVLANRFRDRWHRILGSQDGSGGRPR